MVYIQSLFTSLVCNTKRCIFFFLKEHSLYLPRSISGSHYSGATERKTQDLWRWMQNGCGSAKTCSSCPDHLGLAPKVNQTSSVLYNTLLLLVSLIGTCANTAHYWPLCCLWSPAACRSILNEMTWQTIEPDVWHGLSNMVNNKRSLCTSAL